jgi:hypothetical protein
MLIAIDYDKTWTEDPPLWLAFVEAAWKRGHRVVMVTGRSGWTDDMERGRLPVDLPIVYSGSQFGAQLKQRAALAAGFNVDVWIDDMPGTIQACAILET